MADTPEPFFKATVEGKVYELPKLDLEGSVILKRKFGMKTFENLDLMDPEVLMGCLFLCMKRENPNLPDSKIIDDLGNIDVIAYFNEPDEDEDEPEDVDADPTDDTPPSSKPSGKAKAKAKAGE